MQNSGSISVPTYVKISAIIFIVALTVAISWWGDMAGLLTDMPDAQTLRQWFAELGPWGPVAVVGSMIVAILVSPIPSAPIAMAAGAIYGKFWGSIYTLAGAEAGAVAAFCISRFLGYEYIHRRFGHRLKQGLAGSQRFLMFTVFASRLMPFISFDIVSYAAGLTNLTFWRFAIATLTGIIPTGILLVYFGDALVEEEMDRILIAVLLLGLVTTIPLVVKLISRIRRHS